MQPSFWHPNGPLSTLRLNRSCNGYGEPNYLFFCVITGTICSTNPFNRSWRLSIGQVNEGIRPPLLPNWLWRSFCKRTQVYPMTR